MKQKNAIFSLRKIGNIIKHLEGLIIDMSEFNTGEWLEWALLEEVISKEEYDQQMQLFYQNSNRLLCQRKSVKVVNL